MVGTGLGPVDPAALGAALDGCEVVVARSVRHPGLGEALAALSVPVIACDDLYLAAESFEECYERIATRVVDLARQTEGPVGYVVFGSPLVAEATVRLLRGRDDVELRIVATPGILDGIFARLGLDPLDGVTVVDAATFLENPSGVSETVVLLQVWQPALARDAVLRATEAGARVTLVHHLGVEDEVVARVDGTSPLLDAADHLTTLVLEDYRPSNAALSRLIEVVWQLRQRCPWDQSQTHASLARHLIEEAYELVDAIDTYEDAGDADARDHLIEELGDVLLQVLMHAAIADEHGEFDLGSVATRLTEKLVRRHPHVFSTLELASPAEVEQTWEAIKRRERSSRAAVPRGLPASVRLAKLARQVRAAGATLPRAEGLGAELARAAVAGLDVEAALRAGVRLLEEALSGPSGSLDESTRAFS